MIEAFLIFVAAIWIVVEAVGKLIRAEHLEKPGWGVAIMVVSTVVNVVVSRRLFKVGRSTQSMGQEALPTPSSREMRVYNSVLPELEKSYNVPSRTDQSAPKNRKAMKRKISPFGIVLILLAAAVVSVFYISNIFLTVVGLLTHINEMQDQASTNPE